MKKIFLIAFLFFIVATIVGHAEVLHVGTKNKYPIGNKDISAKVYLQFLKEYAVGEKYSYWHFSKYYEPSFMNSMHFSPDISPWTKKSQ